MPSKECDSCVQCPVVEDSAFGDLRQSLHFTREEIVLEKGRFLFREGQNSKGVFCLLSGKIQIQKNEPVSGLQRSIAFAEPGELLGISAVMLGTTYSTTAICVETSKCCRISETMLADILTANPKLTINLMRMLIHKLSRIETPATIQTT